LTEMNSACEKGYEMQKGIGGGRREWEEEEKRMGRRGWGKN
jgi:hypothetical protein